MIVVAASLLAVALGALMAARIAREETTAEVRAAPTSRPKAERVSDADPRGFVGVIFPRQQVDLAAEASARVMDVKVQLGTPLKKGEVVASLDAASLRRELSAAQAAARAARIESSAAKDKRRALRQTLRGPVRRGADQLRQPVEGVGRAGLGGRGAGRAAQGPCRARRHRGALRRRHRRPLR